MEKGFVILSIMILFFANQVLSYEFCENGIKDDDLRIISVDDMLKENTKEWSWEPNSKIELEIRVENKKDSEERYKIEIVALDSDDDEIDLAENSDDMEIEFTLSAKERKSISIEFEVNEDIKKEEYSLFVKFYEEGNEEDSCTENSEEKILIEKIELCDDDEVSSDKLEILKIKDEGKDEWTWSPGNEIEINVELENKYYDETTFEIELILLDENKKIVDFSNGEIKRSLKLEEGESDDTEFSLELDKSLEEGKYTLYAKAYDENDKDICTTLKASSLSEPKLIKIQKPERKIIVQNVVGPEEARQDDEIEYEVTIFNEGKESEVKVEIIMYSKNMNIREATEIENLKSGEERNVMIKLKVPENASLDKQKITFLTSYEYNEKSKYYKTASEDEDDKTVYITILEKIIEEPEIIPELNIEKEEENFIDENLTIENEIMPEMESLITGSVVQDTNEKGNGFFVLILILIFAGTAIFLIMKKPNLSKIKKIIMEPKHIKKERTTEPIEPTITRRYSAKLDSGEFNF